MSCRCSPSYQMGLYHLLERKTTGRAQATKHTANLTCLLSLNNSKAVKCKHLGLIIIELRLQAVQHHPSYTRSRAWTQLSLTAACNSSVCCRLCEPSCLAFLSKPLDFSSPYTNDDQQANDNHSPQQDSGTPFNKHLPLCGWSRPAQLEICSHLCIYLAEHYTNCFSIKMQY